MAQDVKSKGLGRGLSALLGEAPVALADAADGAAGLKELPIEFLKPNPKQVRKHFDAAYIEELAASIKEKGVLQPLIVRPLPEGGPNMYEIVAGERRWRAAQKAAVHQVPVIIRDLTDKEVLELSLIENVQRTDLNPIEEAMGYRALIDQFGHTQEELATVVGKSRSHIANLLRLLTLPESVQTMVAQNVLSAGHARALIGIDAMKIEPIARDIAERGLSVRQTEELMRTFKSDRPKRPKPGAQTKKAAGKDADTVALERKLSNMLGLRVNIAHTSDGGRLVIDYKSLEQLDEICRLLSRD